MKIKKINESSSDRIDEKYLNFIFSDFIDNGAEVELDEVRGEKYWQIWLEEPPMVVSNFNINEYVNNIEEVYKFSKELDSCFKRIEDDFPDVEYESVIEEIIDEKGNYIFDRGIDRDFEYPEKIQKIIIVTFNKL
jgi:hypothetical protein